MVGMSTKIGSNHNSDIPNPITHFHGSNSNSDIIEENESVMVVNVKTTVKHANHPNKHVYSNI